MRPRLYIVMLYYCVYIVAQIFKKVKTFPLLPEKLQIPLKFVEKHIEIFSLCGII